MQDNNVTVPKLKNVGQKSDKVYCLFLRSDFQSFSVFVFSSVLNSRREAENIFKLLC